VYDHFACAEIQAHDENRAVCSRCGEALHVSADSSCERLPDQAVCAGAPDLDTESNEREKVFSSGAGNGISINVPSLVCSFAESPKIEPGMSLRRCLKMPSSVAGQAGALGSRSAFDPLLGAL
jgi:hypothetical protein